jgi:RNA polymerase sigma-70 factor (ECF subfamily)
MYDFFHKKFLIIRLKRRDKVAFAELYDEFVDRIYRFVLFKVSSVEDAEDITSEVFMKAWEFLGRADAEIRNLKAFLYQLSRNLIVDFYRERAREQKAVLLSHKSEDLERIADEKADLNEKVSQEFMNKELNTLLRYIKEEYRDIVMLKYIEGYSTKEIAEILNRSTGNIRVILHRAMKMLQEAAKKSEENGEVVKETVTMKEARQ